MDGKLRLDVALVRRGLAASRQRAAAMIEAGQVRVNGVTAVKAAQLCDGADIIEATDPLRYVGRGGLKLEGALDAFGIDPAGRVCLDVGASTGGFTDCLLQRGARHVFAVDVGTGQLAEALRRDSRVTALEQTDIRALGREQLGLPVTLAACDVSFISLVLVLPAIFRLLEADGQAVALIKPQFEVGPGKVGKGGLVKDFKAHRAAIERVLEAAKAIGFTELNLAASPILGGDGNQEYLVQLTRGSALPAQLDVGQVVAEAHLRKGR